MKVFRPAKPASTARHVAVTLAQTIVFWCVFLGLCPWLIIHIEAWLDIPRFAIPAQTIIAVAVAVPMAALNLWSGYTMATIGRGTPFPADTASELVIAGPYRFVRNPMATGGLGVGAAVGVYLGSYLTLAYVLAGALAWNMIARPMEERDLAERFGPAYERYRDTVGCWIPRLRAYDLANPSD